VETTPTDKLGYSV